MASMNVDDNRGVHSIFFQPAANETLGVWRKIFVETSTYEGRDALKLSANDPGLAETLRLTGLPSNQQLQKDPSILMVNNGIRHISDARAFIELCETWAPHTGIHEAELQKALGKNDKGDLWSIKPEWFGLSRFLEYPAEWKAPIVIEDIKGGIQWYRPINDGPTSNKVVPMNLEHYFECRFAGPLVAYATKNFSAMDNTTQEALILLDRLMNHPCNLSWTPKTLNKYKTGYFDGTPQIDPGNPGKNAGLLLYLTQKSGPFRGMVERVLRGYFPGNAKPVYDTNTVIIRMLAALWNSPFCRGNWESLPQINGGIQWIPYAFGPELVFVDGQWKVKG